MVVEQMTEQQKRKRILITTSIKGVERAQGILKREGIPSISAFAKAHVLGKSSVDKFLSRQPIQADTFKRICEGLRVKDWREFAELELVLAQCEQETQSRTLQGYLVQDSREVGESFRRVTVLSPIGEVKTEITFEGSIETVTADIRLMMELCMKNAGGDTIRITDVRPGSIKVTVQGSPRDITRLLDQINDGELTEIEGLLIQGNQILSADFLADVGQQSNAEKWHLIDDIVNNPKIARQLSDADLSDADLSNAILVNADLTDADLSGADLSNVDLRALLDCRDRLDLRDLRVRLDLRAHLAHLAHFAHLDHLDYLDCLDRLDLRALLDHLDLLDLLDLHVLHALRIHLGLLDRLNIRDLHALHALRTRLDLLNCLDLYALLDLLDRLDLLDLLDLLDRSTNFEGADLTDTIVEDCQFGDGVGLSAIEKEHLKRRGGIFNDAPGDRSSIETPSPTRR